MINILHLNFHLRSCNIVYGPLKSLRQSGNKFSKDRAGINPIQHLWWMRWCWISTVSLPLPKHHSANAPHSSTTISIIRT